jgi:hypothetical protein
LAWLSRGSRCTAPFGNRMAGEAKAALYAYQGLSIAASLALRVKLPEWAKKVVHDDKIASIEIKTGAPWGEGGVTVALSH